MSNLSLDVLRRNYG